MALALIGCGGLSSGKVVDTRYVAAHIEEYQSYEVWYYRQDCEYDYSTKSEDCHMAPVWHYVTRQRNVPDEWSIKIEGNCKPQGTSTKVFDCEQAWINVDQQTYNKAKNGDLPYYGPSPTPKGFTDS